MIQLILTSFSSKYRISDFLFSCYWKCCKSLSAVHVSGVCMCVTADHNQYMFDREHFSHSKNPISCFWESLNKNRNCFFLPPPSHSCLPSTHAECHMHTPRLPSSVGERPHCSFKGGRSLCRVSRKASGSNCCTRKPAPEISTRDKGEQRSDGSQAQMMGRCSSSRGRCCHDNRSVSLTFSFQLQNSRC